MPGGSQQYRTIVNPASDVSFAAMVDQLATPDLEEPEQLQTALREAGFPLATVTNGVVDTDGRRRWYVYRDGQWRE